MGHYDEFYEHEAQLKREYAKACEDFLHASPTWKQWKAKADSLKKTQIGQMTLAELLTAMAFLEAEPKTVPPQDLPVMKKAGLSHPKFPR